MTIAELDRIIQTGDEDACANLFAKMKESERKDYAPRALQWLSATNGFAGLNRIKYAPFDLLLNRDINFYNSKKTFFPHPFSERSSNTARMAVLASCLLPDIKREGFRAMPTPEQSSVILLDRRPKWIDKWCNHALSTDPLKSWLAVHALEKSGACSIERDSNYSIAMFCALASDRNLYDHVLCREPAVRAELWNMLEDPLVKRLLSEPEQVGAENFRKDWNSGRFSGNRLKVTRDDSNTWRQYLIRLAANRLIDADQLVEYSFRFLTEIGALEHKNLQPVSSAEFAIQLNQELIGTDTSKHLSRFIALLGAVHRDVSIYATNSINQMADIGSSLTEICGCVVPVFFIKHKEPAESALKLLTRLSQEFSSQRNVYGPAILAALGHTSKEVHKRALALIATTDILEDQSLHSDFLSRMEMLKGMERTAAAKLASKYTHGADPINLPSRSCDSEVFNLDDLKLRVKALEPNLAALAFVQESLEKVADMKQLDLAVNLESASIPRLHDEMLLTPIENLEDLLFAITKLWSGKNTSLEREMVLDGIARLCGDCPSDFVEKTDSIRQKTLALSQKPDIHPSVRNITQVVKCWLAGSPASGFLNLSLAFSDASFFAHRCIAIAKRAALKKASPLLAAPTHQSGWIDPVVLVRRVEQHNWLKSEPDEVDFIQALLRLAPDNREQALFMADSLKGDYGTILRYALGRGEIPFRSNLPELWVAAFRSREPFGTSPQLLTMLPNHGPDAAQAAEYEFDPEPVRIFADSRYSLISPSLPNFLPVKSNDSNFPEPVQKTKDANHQRPLHAASLSEYALLPTVLLHDNSNQWFVSADPFIWLHNRESILALFAKRVLQNIDSVGTYWQSDFDFVFDPDVSLDKNGRFFLCLAMSSKNTELFRLSVDALISAVSECRVNANGYGRAMVAMVDTKVITPVRWLRGLRDVAKHSTAHALFVWKSVAVIIMEAELAAVQKLPFLELLCELQLEYKFNPEDRLRLCLGSISGGKAGKLAQTILAGNTDREAEYRAGLQDLQSRINRVERWQKSRKLELIQR